MHQSRSILRPTVSSVMALELLMEGVRVSVQYSRSRCVRILSCHCFEFFRHMVTERASKVTLTDWAGLGPLQCCGCLLHGRRRAPRWSRCRVPCPPIEQNHLHGHVHLQFLTPPSRLLLQISFRTWRKKPVSPRCTFSSDLLRSSLSCSFLLVEPN